MKDVKIANGEKWQTLHWKTICSCYRRSPYFEYFEEKLVPLFEKPYPYLLDYNLASLQLTNELLQVQRQHSLTEAYQKTPGFADKRLTWKAENYDAMESVRDLTIRYLWIESDLSQT